MHKRKAIEAVPVNERFLNIFMCEIYFIISLSAYGFRIFPLSLDIDIFYILNC